MIKKSYYSAIIVSILLLTGCKGLSDADDVNDNLIRDIFYEIETAYNTVEPDAIYKYYHDDYQHKGLSLNEQKVWWQQKLTKYSSLEITNISIDFDSDYATAKFTIKFTGKSTRLIYDDPQKDGNLSYFIREDGKWQLYGNQRSTN